MLSRKQIENLYHDCSRFEIPQNDPAVLKWYSNERKEDFITDFLARNYTGAVMLFSNFQSSARERLVWLCYKRNLLSSKEFSELLEFVYTGQNLQSSFFGLLNLKEIINLFKHADPQHLMTAEEYKRLKSMPDELLIFRGGVTNDDKHSHILNRISWTTSEKIAIKFSLLHQQIFSGYNRIIATGKIQKKHILALFNGRNEDEIVCDPRKVFDIEYVVS
jgi:hypothetical protein